MLSGDLSTASQSSTGAQAERITATWYYKLYGGHWLPPSSGASGSSICWASCRLHQLCCWSCLQRQLSHCVSLYTLFAEPTVDRSANGEAGRKWEEPKELQMRFFSPGWCSSRSGLHNVTPHNHTQPSGLFQGELIYTYRTKVAPGQASTSWRAYAVSAISALSCYITVQSHCLQIMGPENIRSWGERASREPLVEFPTAAMGIDLKSSHLSLSLSHTHTHTPYTRWWMWLLNIVVIILQQSCIYLYLSNHHVVYLKLNTMLCVNYILIKLRG